MNAVEKDDFGLALRETLEFYGKDMSGKQFSFWYRALADYPIHKIKEALLHHTKTGRYAPKPVDIIEAIGQEITPREAAKLPPPEKSKPCPEHIHKAWVWFIHGHSKMEFGTLEKDLTPEQEEKYLHTVNHEARRMNMPDAIPDEFKLKEVWG